MFTYLIIAVGGAIGSMGRYWISGLVAERWGETLPWGTLVVNSTGSLLIGFIFGITAPGSRFLAPVGFREFFMIGICGGYTTFSSFSLQSLQMLQEGEWARAAAYTAIALLTSFIGVWLGFTLAAVLNNSFK
jgi:CrcB protein